MRHPPQSKTVSNMVDFVQSNAFALISEAVGAHAITSACFMRRWASLVAMRRTILDRPADQVLMGRHPFLGVASLARYRIAATWPKSQLRAD